MASESKSQPKEVDTGGDEYNHCAGDNSTSLLVSKSPLEETPDDLWNYKLPSIASPLMPELEQPNFSLKSFLKKGQTFQDSAPGSPNVMQSIASSPYAGEHMGLSVETVYYHHQKADSPVVPHAHSMQVNEMGEDPLKDIYLELPSSPVFKKTSTPLVRSPEPPKKSAADTRGPFIVVSPAGLITVVLRKKMAVEMSIDQAIRLINPRHKSAAAINNKGDASCIVEPLLKVSHDRNRLDVSALLERNVQIDSGTLLFGCREGCFRISNGKMLAALPAFSDLSNDISVTHLFSSANGPHLITECQMVSKNATYETFDDQGSTQIRINGIKITQLANGDVIVSMGKKYLRASALFGSMTVATAEVNMKTDGRGRCRLHHFNNFVEMLPNNMLVSNRLIEGGFNQRRKPFFRPTPIQFRLHGNEAMRPTYDSSQQKNQSRAYHQTKSCKDDYYYY